MTWWHLESAARNNPKCIAAGVDSFALWVLCGLYSSEQHTDGFVPQREFDETVNRWGFTADAIERAMTAGLVPGRGALIEKRTGGFFVHDFGDYNPPGSEVKKLALARSFAGRKGAEARHNHPGKCQKQVPQASATVALAGSVGRSVATDPDPEGGCRGVTAEQVKAVYCTAYLARNGSHPTDAEHGPAKVATWANEHGISWADLEPAIRRIVTEAKGLGLLPHVWDQWQAKPKAGPSTADDWDTPQGPKGRNYDDRDNGKGA